MYVTNSPLLSKLMQQTWQSSAHLAALSAVLARSCPHISPDRALLAGMLQDIGVLPILNVLRQFESQLTDESQITQAVERYAARVGMVLLMQWGFEADMVEVAKSRGSWFRDEAANADLADLVLVARLHQRIVTGQQAGLPAIDQVPAFSKLPVGDLSEDGSLALLHDSAEDVNEVMQLFGASESA
jgi:HD-like signal output (HDOD) protein